MTLKKLKTKTLLLALSFLLNPLSANATFSIAAVDLVTGEVGSAGATCINNFDLGPYISYIVPGRGVVNYQAYGNTSVFPLTLERILANDTAAEVMQAVNDADSNYQSRQRLIITMHGSRAEKSVFTGSVPLNYGGHASEIVGYDYVIGGNLLIGRHVLIDMEKAFNTAGGDLTHKLMTSLKSAVATIGADQRCLQLGVSSATAYVKVAKKTDPVNTPSFSIKYNNITAGVDPITRVFTQYLDIRPDSDNDGMPNILDAFPNDPSETSDWNNDGIGDSYDLDAEGYNYRCTISH